MMENKFTPRAEESLRLAQEAAEEMGHGYVGSEHLLLGLMREEEGIAHRVLEEAGLTDDMICDVLHRSVGTGLSGAAPSQGLTPRAKSAVELAVSEASRTGAGYIGTEHLLMGLLREGNNMAIRVLRTVGIDPKKLYSAVVKKINEAPRAAAAAGGNSAAPSREDGKKGGALAEFTRDLTEAARSGKLDPVIGTMACPVCGTALQPDDVWLKKGSSGWYTLSQCPVCKGRGGEAGRGVFQKYRMSRRDGLHWAFARCVQMPDDASLVRWKKQKAQYLERQRLKAERQAAEAEAARHIF